MYDTAFRCTLMLLLFALQPALSETTEFCLDGEFDLGLRLQGTHPEPGEFYPATWCVITEGDGGRVRFHGRGRSNPDLEGDFTVAFLPPDRVRIVNADQSPDLEFVGADAAADAARHRRIDPRRLAEEIETLTPASSSSPAGASRTVSLPDPAVPVRVRVEAGRVHEVHTQADLPLRGRVPVTWRWNWIEPESPSLTISIDGRAAFRARGSWRTLKPGEAEAVWAPSGGEYPREIDGENWPSRVSMRLETLGPGTHRVLGVRTGFHHLIVETSKGLVVADAPAGWVELQQIPPVDLIGTLGVSGLSEHLIDFLKTELPGQPIRAVVLTHAHDDHAGGARAFAAEDANIYAPEAVSGFLESALDREAMPPDRFEATGNPLEVKPVSGSLRLDDPDHPVRIIDLGPGPHASASLGVLAESTGHFFVSDVHVPTSDSRSPRRDRAHTECWFARRAIDTLPAGTRIVNSHTRIVTSTEILAGYLASDACAK